MKKLLLSMLVCVASLVSYVGIYPNSWFSLYQPQFPEDLIR